RRRRYRPTYHLMTQRQRRPRTPGIHARLHHTERRHKARILTANDLRRLIAVESRVVNLTLVVLNLDRRVAFREWWQHGRLYLTDRRFFCGRTDRTLRSRLRRLPP